jgi:hypothetical protein
MPRQNRVTPFGELVAVPDRGLSGNRGALLDSAGRLARYSRGRHRPCGECRYRDYQAFKRFWAAAFGGGWPGVAEIDGRLHEDRLVRPGVRRSYSAPLAELPDGVMVSTGGAPFLVHDGTLVGCSTGAVERS